VTAQKYAEIYRGTIRTGDKVAIQDSAGNIARGTVKLEHDALSLMAFGVKIQFGHLSREGNWINDHSLKVIEHLPTLA
jgi:hypothetical protein